MKQLFLTVLILLFLSSVAIAEEDYKRLYLEQKAQSLRIELQAIQMRFTQIQNELPQVLAELNEYTNKEIPTQDEKDAQSEEK